MQQQGVQSFEIARYIVDQILSLGAEQLYEKHLIKKIPIHTEKTVIQLAFLCCEFQDYFHEPREEKSALHWKQDEQPVITTKNRQLGMIQDSYEQSCLFRISPERNDRVASQTPSLISTSYGKMGKKMKRSLGSKKKKPPPDVKFYDISNNPSISTIQYQDGGDDDSVNVQELLQVEQQLRKKVIAQQKYRKFQEDENRKQTVQAKNQYAPNMTNRSAFSKLDIDKVTYDSNGKVLEVVQNNNKKKKKDKSYQTIQYSMMQQKNKTKSSSSKLPSYKRKENNQGFKNEKQFFEKIQKQHDINPNIQQKNVPKQKEVFMTSLKNDDYAFSHPKVDDKNQKKNSQNPWNIKPGIKVLENGKLVLSQGRVSQKNKMSLYSFNQRVQQEQREYMRQQGGCSDVSPRPQQPQQHQLPYKNLQSKFRYLKGRGSISSKSTIVRPPTQPSQHHQHHHQNKFRLKFPSLPKMNQPNAFSSYTVRTIQSNQRPLSGKIINQMNNYTTITRRSQTGGGKITQQRGIQNASYLIIQQNRSHHQNFFNQGLIPQVPQSHEKKLKRIYSQAKWKRVPIGQIQKKKSAVNRIMLKNKSELKINSMVQPEGGNKLIPLTARKLKQSSSNKQFLYHKRRVSQNIAGLFGDKKCY